MYHHSKSDYNVASSEAASRAKEKFQRQIDAGTASAMSVIEQVQNQIISDQIAHSSKFKFDASSVVSAQFNESGSLLENILDNANQNKREVADSGLLNLILSDNERKLHNHALRQAVTKAGFPNPQSFINFCYELKATGREMLAENLNKVFNRADFSKNYLIRSVGDETRGIVSDKFKRLDSRPLLDAFCEGCQQTGLLPIKGYALDTKVLMRAVLPYVFEPIDNEVMIFGIEWSNSDFGDGSHSLKLWNERIWCSNHATLSEVLRNIHIGKRLDDSINYSQETQNLDTQANASALKDTIIDCLSPVKVDAMLASIKKAYETEVTPGAALNELKKYLNKGEVEEAVAAFNSPDIINLPPGQNQFRLSNAVSWIANTKDAYRQLELQTVAGKLLPKVEFTETVVA